MKLRVKIKKKTKKNIWFLAHEFRDLDNNNNIERNCDSILNAHCEFVIQIFMENVFCYLELAIFILSEAEKRMQNKKIAQKERQKLNVVQKS